MDSDMLVMGDISEVFNEVDDKHDVFCVHHDYMPKGGFKFLGNVQHVYPRKNWSSFMVFNNARCKTLTPERVNTASGSWLHQFVWANHVGSLSPAWNHLVGEYRCNPVARVAHFTLGAPCFDGYEDQEFSGDWFRERELMNAHQ